MRIVWRGIFSAITVIAMHLGVVTVAWPATQPHLESFDVPATGAGPVLGTGCFGCTFSINQEGVVAGTFIDANVVFHGFIRKPDGTFTIIDAPAADTTAFSFHGTAAQSINDFGAVTGYYVDAMGMRHGFLRDPGGVIKTFDAPGATNGSTPIYLSFDGNVVGFSLDSSQLFHAFLRRPDGTFAVFVGPGSCTSGTSAGCFGSEATHVDFFGTSVGNFMDSSANLVSHGLIRDPFGKLTTFDATGAGTGFYQGTGCPGCNLGVNIWGAIAGTYVDASYVIHGFLRTPAGAFISFDAPGAGTSIFQGTGCFSDCPVGLNDFGVITGSFSDANGIQHGYVRSPAGNITAFDPPGSTGTQPESINDFGSIVGYYVDANGAYHGFLRR